MDVTNSNQCAFNVHYFCRVDRAFNLWDTSNLILGNFYGAAVELIYRIGCVLSVLQIYSYQLSEYRKKSYT